MKKSEMIEVLANQTGLTKADVERVFNGTFDLFKSELDMVSYIANLLAEKILKVYQLNHEYYYICQS